MTEVVERTGVPLDTEVHAPRASKAKSLASDHKKFYQPLATEGCID